MGAASAKISEWLGVQPPASEKAILGIVEGRLAPSVIKRLAALGLAALGFERAEINAAVIPSRTLQTPPASARKADRGGNGPRIAGGAGFVFRGRSLWRPGTGAGVVEATTQRSRRAVALFATKHGHGQPHCRRNADPD